MTICAACGDLTTAPVVVRGLDDAPGIVEVGHECCLDEVLRRGRLRPAAQLSPKESPEYLDNGSHPGNTHSASSAASHAALPGVPR